VVEDHNELGVSGANVKHDQERTNPRGEAIREDWEGVTIRLD
jgi:hypothetical protein